MAIDEWDVLWKTRIRFGMRINFSGGVQLFKTLIGPNKIRNDQYQFQIFIIDNPC